jgi:hypothetical protein
MSQLDEDGAESMKREIFTERVGFLTRCLVKNNIVR